VIRRILRSLVFHAFCHHDDHDELSYHDVDVYVDDVRYKVSHNYNLELTCTRSGGWRLWKVVGKFNVGKVSESPVYQLIGGEYDDGPFCVAVRDKAIVGKVPKTWRWSTSADCPTVLGRASVNNQ